NRDLKLENLVRDPASGAVTIVDLDGVRRNAPLDRRGTAADLGRLYAAWHDAAPPHEALVVRAFWHQYHRTRRCLRSKPNKDLRRRSAVRARDWERSHPAAGGRCPSGVD